MHVCSNETIHGVQFGRDAKPWPLETQAPLVCDMSSDFLWRPQDLSRVIPELDAQGIDLMSQMLQYDPAKRIHATEALKHPYFDTLEMRPKKIFKHAFAVPC